MQQTTEGSRTDIKGKKKKEAKVGQATEQTTRASSSAGHKKGENFQENRSNTGGSRSSNSNHKKGEQDEKLKMDEEMQGVSEEARKEGNVM